MIDKAQLLAMIRDEARICTHLHSKLPGGQLDYAPGENMRTTLELLRYLTYCGSCIVDATLNDDWSITKSYAERAATMTADEFPARMQQQVARIEELMAPITDDELRDRQVKLPWGTETTLGASLLGTTFAFLNAYRMQLFTYAKASGAKELNTNNAWMGMDPPPKP